MTLSKIKLTRSCLHSDKLSDGLAKSFLPLKLSGFQQRQECQVVYPLIEQIFEFEIGTRDLVVEGSTKILVCEFAQSFLLLTEAKYYLHTGPFRKKVHDWFQGKPSLMQDFQLQTVTTVYNKWTRVTTVRNPLRSDRPRPESSGDHDDIMDLINGANQSICDFCEKIFAEAY